MQTKPSVQVEINTGYGNKKWREEIYLLCSIQMLSTLLLSKSQTAIIPEHDPVAINDKSVLTVKQHISSLTCPPTECLSK
jgi:hypothetical protein